MAQRAPQSPAWPGLLALAVAGATFAWTLALAAPHFFPMLFQDQLATVSEYRRVLDRGLSLALLFAQHNEHRLLFPRLVFFADLHVFGGISALNRAVSAAGLLAGAALFWSLGREARRTPAGAVGVALAMTLMVCMLHWQNLLWGFQLQFVWVFVAGGWAIWLFFQGADRERPRPALVVAAIGALVVATFCMANGLLAGWSAVAVAVATRRRWLPTLAFAACCAGLTGLYLSGFETVGGHSPPALVLEKPKEFAYYVAMYLGAAAETGHPRRAFLFGLAAMAAAVGAGLLALVGRARRAEELALAAIMLFLGLSAAVTGVGRLSFGLIQAISARYFTPSAMFVAALVLFWTLQVSGASSRALKLAWTAAAVVGLAAVVWMQPRLSVNAAELDRGVRLASDALLVGADDPDALKGLFPDPAYVLRDLDFLRARRLAVFHGPEAGWAGRPAGEVAAPAPAEACLGFLEVLTAAPAGAGRRATGWAWDREAGRPAGRVLLTDGDGKIIGLATGGLPRPDVRQALRDPAALRTGWTGAVRGGAGPVAAHALLADGRACPLKRN